MSIQLPPGFKWETPPADEAPKAQARPALPDGFKWESAAPSIAEPPSFTGAMAKGFKRSLPETKSLLAGAGAAAAGAVGLDGVRDKLLDTYQGIQQTEVAPLQAKTGFIDAVTGDGSLKEWAGDTLGNFGGQAVQSLAAAGAGALVGSAVPGAGTVAGGVGGLLFKAGAKEMVTDAVGRMVAKGVAKDVAEKTALRRLGGAAIAGTGLNVGQEVGIGFTGRAEDAAAAGEQLNQQDALRAIGYGIPAGLVDTAAEALTGSRLMQGVSDSPKMLRRMAKGAGIGAVSEGATEGVQAVLERAGAARGLTGEEAYRDYIENAAAGALGGGVAGAGGGFRRQQDPAAPPPPETPPPMTPEVNASQALPPASSPLATPPAGPLTRAAATVPGAAPLATPPADVTGATAQTPTDALPPLIADTAAQAVAAPPAADPVFEQAKQLLGEAGKVQRGKLAEKLGLNRNQMQTLLDQLHAAGIVGPSNGKKARKLLVNPITGDVLDPDEKARLDRKVQRDAEQKALEEAVRGGKPAAAIEAAAAAQGQQPAAAPTLTRLSQPPDPAAFEAKMREKQAAALTRAQRPDPAAGATSAAAAVAFDTGAAAIAEQQNAQAAQDQQAQAAVTAQAEADKAQQQQQKVAEKAAKEADKAARQAEKDRVQAEKTAPAQDVDIQAVVAAEIEAGKPMDGMRMHALAKKLNVTPKRIDDMRMALAQAKKRGEPPATPPADSVEQYDDSPDVTEDDITPPSGGAFSIRSAAESTAKRTPGGKVFEVDGGFVVRVPKTPVAQSATTEFVPATLDSKIENGYDVGERALSIHNQVSKHVGYERGVRDADWVNDPFLPQIREAYAAGTIKTEQQTTALYLKLLNNAMKAMHDKAVVSAKAPETNTSAATVKKSLTVAAAKPKAELAADVAGEQLDDKWTAFAPETGTLNVPRADMPQVKSVHRGAMVQFLGARGITHEQAEVPADSLKPTQAEFSASKVKKALKRAAEGEDRAILVSADGHVLDGHHQWLAKREAGAPVKVIRLNAPIAELLQQVKEFPSSTQAKGATTAEPAPTSKREVADATFQSNRDAIKREGFKKGDQVEFTAPGPFTNQDGTVDQERVRRGTIEKIDEDQGVVKVMVPGTRGVADYHVQASRLRRAPSAPEKTNAKQEAPRTEQAAATGQAAAEAKPEALLSETPAKPEKPSGTMARQRMPRGDAVAEVQRQLKVTKKRATEIVNEIRSEAKNLDGVTYNLKPGIVQTADVQAAIERELAAQSQEPAPAQQALQESEWDQIVSTHKLRLQQKHGIASRTAGNPVSWQYMKEPQRAKLAADVRAIIANGGIDPQVDDAPAQPEKGIVGRRADGVMIREDERGVRWYAQGGVRIFETVSMRPTRQGMQIDRGVLQREFMTAEESAAAAKAAAPTEQPKAKPTPSANTIVTDADAEAARARLKAKFNRLNSGIDPEMMLDGITLGMYHIERGARTFAAYAKAMVDDLGDAVKPYLKSWYMGVKYDPRAAGFDGMDSAASVESAVVDSTPEPEQDSVTEDSTDAAPKPVEPSVRGGDPEGAPVTEGRRERASQPGNAPPDTGDVASAQPEDVETTGASESGGSVGIRGSATDVEGKQESQGSGNARPGRKGAGGKKPPDAGAGRTDTAEPVGRTGDGAAGREGSDPRGPEPKDAESVSPANPGPGNFHIANPLEVVGGGQVARFNKNKAAIELFVALRDEGRRPTREEQEVLAGYTGWGSFGQDLFQGSWAYPQPKQGWEQRDQWLRDHLGRSDWEGLQRSITNAHYTDPPTVMAMWEMVRRMGFKGGRVLEPGMGIGNFFGMMPLDLKERSKLAGIELDPVTGGMAQMLYPDAAIKVMGYQDSKTPDDFYDLVIGNWPFENTPVADRRYNRLNPMLHDYFFLKTLDQVRPGGIVIGITSAGSMDKKGAVVRRELAKKAELIASFRLPSGAFEDYAGTKVVTDIIVLRKRPEPASNVDGEAWVDTVEMDTPAGEKVRVNSYYQKNPQNVVGTIDYGHGTTTFRPGLIVHRPENMQAQLDRIVSMVPDGAYLAATRPDAVSYIANHTSDREGALTRTDAGLFIVRGEHLAPAHEVFKYQVKSQKDTAAREAQLNALIDMRKSYGQLIEAERGTSGAAPDPIRTQLRERYEAFIKAYGPMSESFGLGYLERIDDPFYYALAALETKDGNTYRPAAILSQSTIRSAKRITNPSIRDAFVLARNGNVNPSLDEIAKIAQKPEAMVRAELVDSGAVFETPGGDIVPSDMYLSGNVREKLRQAKVALADGNDAMQRNVAALEKVQPADIPYFNIEVQMGATWVPTRAYEQFVAHMLNRGDTDGISASYTMGRWKVTVDPSLQRSTEAQTGFGTRYYRFGKLVNAAISNQTVVIKERDRDGREFVNQAATDETNAKIADMREKFGDWLWSDAERRIEIEREYNEVRNAYASPSFDGSFLNFDGMALSVGRGPFDLRQHQVNAIWRALVMRRSLNAHEVGTGKTFTMGGIAVESRRYGIAKKPVLLAHNANSKSVASEIQMMYPAAKVLYIDNLSPKAIDVRLRQIANDDWDLIVLPHSLIERLSFREETLMAMAREEIEALEAEARLAAGDDGQNFTDAMLDDPDELKKLRSPTAKELVKARARIIETIKKQAQQSSREGAVPFEDLGIDMVLVDEAHEFKKPPIATRMKMKGLQTQSSLGSIQLSFLTRYVREQNNGGNVHLFTGTPITNTLTEIFHQMRYIMADEMAAVGVDQWDGWFGSFAKEVQDVELTAAGDYEAVNRLRGFINVPELRKMVGQYMDVVFSDDMPEMQPRRTASGKLLADQSLTERERAELLNGRTEGAKDRPYKKVVNETADPTPDQMRIFEEVQSLANEWRNMGGKARRDAMSAGLPVVPIVYEQLAARASFDARMENDEALAGKEGSVPDHPDSKVSRAIRNLLEIYRSDTRATQVVFTNTGLGTTANRALRDGAGGTIKDADGVTLRRQVKVFSPIKDMVERLVQQGIPRSEIEIVDGSTSKDRRKEIADAMNAGTVRIVIGSTQSLGVGVNMQRNLRAMHHLDAPWMPGDLEQRNGRGHRQGNQWNTVMEYRYITDRIDGRRWQVLAIKQKFITDFLKADGDTRVIEGDAASDEESDIISTFAEAAGDPRVLIRQKLVAQVEQLQKRERLHTEGVADAKRTARNAREDLARRRAEIERIEQSGAEEKAAKAVADHAGDKFRITVDGAEFSERKEANEAIGKFIGANMRTGADPMRIGSYGGLPLHVAWPRFYEAPVFVAVVAGEEVATGAASVASLESSLRAYTGTVDKLRARIQPALETIQRLDEVAGQKFQRADQLKRAEQQLLNLEKDIQLNPVPPPAWLRNGAAIDTEVRWSGTAFVVTGHRWNGAGWFVIAQDAKGGEVVIPYLDAKDAQGMPLYEQREFKAPIVHAKKDEAPKDGTGPTLETVVQTNVSNAEPAPPGQPAAGIESTPARTVVGSRPYFRNFGGDVVHEPNAKKIELSEMPDGEFYIAPGLARDSGQFEIMEATTGLRVGLGKTRKAAIEAANKAIVENRATIKTALEQRAFPKDKLDAAIAKLDGGNRASFAKADKPNAPGARGMPEKNLTRLLATAKQAMALLGVNIEVVANGSDLPAEITAQDDYDDTVQAAITGDRKTVYFVASRIASPRAAIKLVAHELVGHMSMEQLLGKRWPELRDAILRLRDNGKWPEVFAEVSKRYERNADGTFRPLDDATFAAEAIAVFAERNIQTSILQRAVNSVRAWLRRLGFAMDMSQGELRQMLWEAGQKLEGRAYRAAVVDDVLGAKVEPKQMSMREAVQRYSFGKDDETPELKAQFDATARAYGGEQAWQRAKDSGRTKLNYVQWVQVRTPAFKAWFGDWEATAHRAFLDGAPVSELTGDEFKPDGVPLTTKVPEWYAKQKVASVEVDGIGAVALDVQAVKNSMSHGIGRDKVAAFAAVPDVLRLGKIVHREQMRGSNVGMVYHVAAPISIGGQEFVADVLVKADENTRRMYVHEVAVKEKLQQSVFKTGAVAAEAGKLAGTDAGAIRSVLQGIYAVNPDTVSKVIDQTTGEPLAANFAKAQPAPDDKAAFAKAGTLVDRLGTQMNPHGDPSVLDWIKNRLSAMRPAALGALTLRMLGEVAEKILPSVARYSGVVQLMDTMRKELQELGQDVVKASMDYQAKNSAEAREMFSMLHDATLEGVDPSQRQVAEMPDGTLKFIDDATPKQIEKLKDAGATIKRGQFHEPLMMVSEDYKTNVPVTEASVKAFIKVMRKQMKLNPGSAVAYMNREKEARKLRAQERKRIKSHMDMVPRFNALSDDGKKLWGQMRDAYRTQSNKYLEALLSRIDSLNLDKSKKAEQIARMRMKFESSRVPFYVPLARWGNYWVSGTNDKGKREFYMQESPTAQDEVIRDLTARGFTKIGKGVKLDTVRAQDGASATFMADIDDMLVKSGAPDKIRDEAFQLYLAALPDLSMRKAFIHRKGTRGYSEDAPRALAAHIFHGSFQIARLRYSHELEALRVEAEKESKAMSDEAHEEAVAAGHIVNELKKRHEWVMNPQDNALLNKISSLGFVYYLGLTPASALVNLLATPMVALPILAATGNWASASKHLWRAFKESAGSYGHMEKVLTNEDEIAAHKEFERRGVLDRSQVHNLAGIAESDSFAYSPKWHKTMTIISHMFHKAEVVNREATTMASYRMQREAGIGHEEAMNLAEQQTYEAHLDYSNANRARFMQSGTAKVLLMFRQYSLGMTWLIGRNLWKSDLLGGALGGKTDKAELREARRKVAGILGMTAIFSGTLGLPIIGTVGAVLNAVAAAFGDDDEPWDWETEFRAFLREMLGETGAEAVLRGPVQAATGVGISNRVSMGDLWFREPDRELEGRAWSNYLFEQAAGPMGGLITNFFRGQQLMGEGQVWRGVETMMPKAIKDAMKSLRYLDEGVNNLRGDAIVEDLNVFESLAQIAGFAPASVANAYDTARDIKNYEQAILNRRSRLMDAFALAWRLGDVEAREAVLVKMRTFSQTYPELAITGDSIRRSLMQRAKASTQADNGVIIDKRIRARLEGQLGMAAP